MYSKWITCLAFAFLVGCAALSDETTAVPNTASTPTETNIPSPTITPSLIPTFTPFPPTPTLSPSLSSLRVAFIYDKQLWIWKNNSATSLTNIDYCSQIKISSDGEMVAFGRDELWVINNDGTNLRPLVSADDFKSMKPGEPGVLLNQFSWIPGTHNLLFNTRLLLDYGQNPTNDLYRADADTLQWTILRQPGEGGAYSVSPDGRQVVIVTPSQINLMDIDSSHYRTLLEYPYVMIPSETHYYAHPVWASNSQSLMVAIPPQDVYYETTLPLTIWQLALDGTPPTIVAELPSGFSESISPDISKIAYTRRVLRQANWESELHISNIDGSEDTIYGDATTNFHVWAPDSEHFVFLSGSPTRYYLGKIGADPIPLTGPTSVMGFLSLVDETHFLDFGREENEPFGLRLGTFGESSLLLPPWEKLDDCLDYDFVK